MREFLSTIWRVCTTDGGTEIRELRSYAKYIYNYNT
jgi:hypothetical protein